MSKGCKTKLLVQVYPNTARNEVKGFENDVLHIRIAAPPVKGKANKELIEFISKLLGVSKSGIRIEKGITSRRKVLAIEGLTQAQVSQRLK